MVDQASDPYAVLGVPRGVSEAQLRRTYRALVKQHHPDHNGGSAESAARFALIQEAYTAVKADVSASSSAARAGQRSATRTGAGRTGAARSGAAQAGAARTGTGPKSGSPPGSVRTQATASAAAQGSDLEARIREMEQDIAQSARQRAAAAKAQAAKLAAARQQAAKLAAARQQAAYESVLSSRQRRPTAEELGYYSTDDSISQIVDDATGELARKIQNSDAKRQFTRRLTDLFGSGQ
ncbi:MAG: J domain-containing protein [Solirubrobacteraceae bacterium]